MKRVLTLALIMLFGVHLAAQVSEAKSGVQKISISRKGADLKKLNDESRRNADNTPPVIRLNMSDLSADSLVTTDSKTLIVKGTVTDLGGVFEVLVNGTEAILGTNGEFSAEIPLAVGSNFISVRATDAALNYSTLRFRAERSGATIPSPSAIPAKPVNVHSISITNPGEGTITSSDILNLKACLKSTTPITKLMVYRNNSFVNGFLAKQVVKAGDCDFALDQPVPLALGINDIRIELFSGGDTVVKSITVEYSFHAARNHALIIANDTYDDPDIVNLSQPTRDATELYNTLLSKYNFKRENVRFLKNPTKAEIIGTLHELRSVIKPDDNFLIFYAGHGYWDEGMGVGYWLPRDAAKSNPVNWIPNTDLTNYLGAIKSKHTLLIADACFSGGIFKSRSAFSNTFAVEKLYQLNSRKAITSGTLTEVPDNSVFFRYLIKKLKENNDEYLPAEQLFSEMRIAVINNSQNVPQYGTIQNVGDEGGDFIFIIKK